MLKRIVLAVVFALGVALAPAASQAQSGSLSDTYSGSEIVQTGGEFFGSVAQGLAHFWRDGELRTCFLYWSAVALFIMGPIHIAIPVLASSTPALGAAAFGIIVGAHGAGTLLGMVVSGMLPRLRIGSLGMTILAFDAVIGALFVPMGLITAVWQGALLMLVPSDLAAEPAFPHPAPASANHHPGRDRTDGV